MDFHPIANIFPLLQGDEYEQLKDDVARNGLIEPIWLHPDGRIIDGRNRWRACVDTNTNAHFNTWNGNGSLVEFVISLNLHRRHLTPSQAAAIALEVLPMLEEEARDRQRKNALTNQPQNSQKVDYLEDVPKGKAAEQAARLFQTNRQYVSDAKHIQEQAPELLDRVKSGELSMPKAKQELINRANGKMDVHYSSETPEWHTPPDIITKVVQVFGQIDLDPCSNPGIPNVPAKNYYTKDDNGLSKPWYGKVYMNPPYGREIEDWVDYLCQQWEAGNVTEAIALVPSRTDTKWFRKLEPFIRCFIYGRLRFSRYEDKAPFPSMAVYIGAQPDTFKSVFGDIGGIYRLD